ncbi:hypothetical protein C6N75_10160 [Streptomyces solincola]|uniref:Uncharacterized protein n=1 Tax=Streptomyces solincola TaxID=2100817 RepID=A0A2S9PY22_9ACTN|nr:AAA family ATPase [Streptomyces solincola]PRH79321.1 hypothetical protein C6N75_10160 [Streptomyces solincola]
MDGVRVVLIGGTSHTGKSTVARAVADRLGFAYRSTDGLARHPGRPWPTPEWRVPPHVAAHYRSLTVDELIASVLDHYARLWPRIEELVTGHALAGPDGGGGLVLEGSALWPGRVAGLTVPHTAAVWLTADEEVLAARVRAAAGYDRMEAQERAPVDGFLARMLRFQSLLLGTVGRLGLDRLDTSDGREADALAGEVVAVAAAQHAVGRSGAGSR